MSVQTVNCVLHEYRRR